MSEMTIEEIERRIRLLQSEQEDDFDRLLHSHYSPLNPLRMPMLESNIHELGEAIDYWIKRLREAEGKEKEKKEDE